MNRRYRFGRNSSKSRCPDESGQAIVETAITLSLLVIMLIGSVVVGRIAYAAIQVTDAAKAAVQYGCQNHNTAVDTVGMQAAAANAAPELTNLSTQPASPVCSCANDGTAVSCTDTTACPSSTIIETLTVNTSASFDPLFHLPGMPSTFTLSGQAVQQVLSVND